MSSIRKLKVYHAQPIREHVFSQLRELILSGQIPTGERLVESRLASELGTSRTPIREALHKLELENLVTSLPRVGYFVQGFSEEDIRDICEIRMALESLAARRAISRLTEKDLERLKRNLDRSKQAIDQKKTEKMVDLDTEFHDILCQSSGSQRIYELSQTMREYMLKPRKECLRLQDIACRALVGHERIYQALCRRDGSSVRKSIEDHLRDVMKDVTKYYESRGEFLREKR